MNITNVFSRNIAAYNTPKYRVMANKGGTRSSKTYSILQLLYLIARQSNEPLVISVVSESFPHLARGCIRDFEKIVRDEDEWNEKSWNRTNKVYKIGNSKIEFFSADQPAKVHGPSRDILYINECINISYETFRQLDIRTRKKIFLDCNPCFEFWLDVEVIPKETTYFIHSTYKDNIYLPKSQVSAIESYQADSEFWKVYGMGETGSKIGLIIQNWDAVNKFPEYVHSGKRYIGMDFGFTNHPTAIIDIYFADGQLWINELLYDIGYDNLMISNFLKDAGIPPETLIIADSAEPKSIHELRAAGWNIEPAHKPQDSVVNGLSILNRYKKNVTKSSLNVINEFRNYRWKIDIDGNPTNQPIKMFDHATDAIRYVCYNKLGTDGNIFNTKNIMWT